MIIPLLGTFMRWGLGKWDGLLQEILQEEWENCGTPFYTTRDGTRRQDAGFGCVRPHLAAERALLTDSDHRPGSAAERLNKRRLRCNQPLFIAQ